MCLLIVVSRHFSLAALQLLVTLGSCTYLSMALSALCRFCLHASTEGVLKKKKDTLRYRDNTWTIEAAWWEQLLDEKTASSVLLAKVLDKLPSQAQLLAVHCTQLLILFDRRDASSGVISYM